MADPREHPNDSFLSRILKKIPGFGGYIDQESRQESDEKTRTYLAAELQKSKGHLDQFGRALVDDVKLDDVAECEKWRDQLDTVIQHLRSRVSGYSRFFGSTKIDEDQLEDVYDLDVGLINTAEDLTGLSARLAESKRDSDFQEVKTKILSLKSQITEREDMLKQLS